MLVGEEIEIDYHGYSSSIACMLNAVTALRPLMVAIGASYEKNDFFLYDGCMKNEEDKSSRVLFGVTLLFCKLDAADRHSTMLFSEKCPALP